jgi:hypothetical protein
MYYFYLIASMIVLLLLSYFKYLGILLFHFILFIKLDVFCFFILLII